MDQGVSTDSASAQVGSGAVPRRKLPAWLSLKAVLFELIAVALGVVAGQIALPRIFPQLEKWTYQFAGISLFEPSFLVLASDRDVAAGAAAVAAVQDYQRLFCGISLHNAKYCLMHRVVLDPTLAPSRWKLGDGTTKAAFVGERGNEFSLSWVSTASGLGGAAFAVVRAGDGAYAGYGIGCASLDGTRERPTPFRILYGRLEPMMPAGGSTPTSLDFLSAILTSMSKSTTTLRVVDPAPCTSSPGA